MTAKDLPLTSSCRTDERKKTDEEDIVYTDDLVLVDGFPGSQMSCIGVMISCAVLILQQRDTRDREQQCSRSLRLRPSHVQNNHAHIEFQTNSNKEKRNHLSAAINN